MCRYARKGRPTMASERKQYSPEFKARVVIEALKEERGVNEIAADNGLNPNLVFKWRKQFLDHPERVFDETRRQRDEKAKEEAFGRERDEMLKTIGSLTLERDWLRRSCEKFGVDPGALAGGAR